MLAITEQQELLIRHYIDLEQYEKAIPLLRDALAGDPLNGKWHYEWANAHFKLDRYEPVEEHLQEALRLGHSPVQTYFLLGSFYQKEKRYGRAQAAFQEALRLSPRNAVVMAAFAYLRMLMKQKKEAYRMIDEALRLNPGSPSVLNFYVNIQLQTASKRKKNEAMLMRIHSGGSEKNRQVVMGLYELQRKNYQEAREHYRQAYLLDPLDKSVQNTLYRTNLLCNPAFSLLRWTIKLGGAGVVFLLLLLLFVLAAVLNWGIMAGILALLFIFYLLYAVIAANVIRFLMVRHEKKTRKSEHLHG